MSRAWLAALSLLLINPAPAGQCGAGGAAVQVLGSGGPELTDERASAGYLLWIGGRARVLIDAGSGSLRSYEATGAELNDLDAVLFSHLHVDHSSELPALIKATYFSRRGRDLRVYGPTGNELMPPTTVFVERLFGPDGAYRYLSDYYSGAGRYQIRTIDVEAGGKGVVRVHETDDYALSAVPVNHGPVPALAWRVEVAGQSVVFGGDMSNRNGTLAGFAADADLLVAHHAIPEGLEAAGRRLHMPPSEIGKVAREAAVAELVLGHRMRRTLGAEDRSIAEIRRHYPGPLTFAEDLLCIPLVPAVD